MIIYESTLTPAEQQKAVERLARATYTNRKGSYKVKYTRRYDEELLQTFGVLLLFVATAIVLLSL